jgi:transaldolase
LISKARLQAEEGLLAPIKYRTADVDGFKVFYREAGPTDAPTAAVALARMMDGVDGWVSLEVSAFLAHDTNKTLAAGPLFSNVPPRAVREATPKVA